ncbi:Trypsin I-P38 [Orchesella cincta]|uniref:Trypsin I-P38 n=1 Tax=Orchesella cincta TaxID=48709 RepID=A0A1D2N213_ORCCI|nr:Trypsin I-P38 [Orchesella cincta]
MWPAHCTRSLMPLRSGDKLYVVVGDHDRTTSTDAASQQIEVTSYVDHPAYNPNTMDNDVSLLKLASRITMSNTISPVCLPWKYVNDNFQGTTITASGWGTTMQGGSFSNQLREVDLPVLTTEECAAYLPGQITQNMICTYFPGKDTCQGDSGGSIDLERGGRYYAIGSLIAFNSLVWFIQRRNYPGVYAKTTKYLDWIQTTASGETFCKA